MHNSSKLHTSKVHILKEKKQKILYLKVHSFKEFIKNCISQVFSDTIQKCLSSRITKAQGAYLKGLLYYYFIPSHKRAKSG